MVAKTHDMSYIDNQSINTLIGPHPFLPIVQSLKTTVPSSSFTPDITPIILAGHRDNYEIIKILLDRGYRIPKPHNARCSCKDCIQGSQDDSLRHSRSSHYTLDLVFVVSFVFVFLSAVVLPF